jgi:hypothetical protein
MEPTDKLDYPPDGIYTAAIYMLYPLGYLRIGSTEKLENLRMKPTENLGYPHMYSNPRVCCSHLHAAVSNWQPPDGIYREAELPPSGTYRVAGLSQVDSILQHRHACCCFHCATFGWRPQVEQRFKPRAAATDGMGHCNLKLSYLDEHVIEL